MKSAYEIAMERLQKETGTSRTLSDEDRARIVEVDRKYEALIAETRVQYDQKLAAASPVEQPGLREESAAEVTRLRDAWDAEKDRIWQGSGPS